MSSLHGQSFAYLERADKYCKSAELLLDAGDYESSVSRSYYAMFFAAEAALLTKGMTQSTHSGIHRLFGEHFIVPGIFPVEMGRNLARAFGKRQIGDYESEFLISREEAERLCQMSTDFVTQIRIYLNEQNSSEQA